MYPLVSGYKLLVRDTCIRLHVSGANAALYLISASSHRCAHDSLAIDIGLVTNFVLYCIVLAGIG